MKRFSEELHKKALTVKLKAAERDALRERVLSYMEYHPLATQGKRTISKSERALLSEPYHTVSFSWRQFFSYGSVAAVVCAITISYSAEQAIPGDALYPVKVKFNEEVRSSLTLSPYEKVTWETERLNRRIAEARVLASEGKLTTEAEAAVVAAVRTHSAEARREIDELRVTDKDEASLAALHLATTLDVQSAALRQTEGGADLSGNQMTFSAQVDDLAAGSDEVAEENPIAAIASAVEAERRETVLPAQDTLPSFDRLVAHAESDTTRARELLVSINATAATDEVREVTRRLEDIERLMARALSERGADEGLAQETLTEVIARTQKLIVYMTNIDVREVLSVENLVPVELTDDERRVVVVDALGRARSLVAQVETARASITLTADIAGKVDESLGRVATLMADAEAALSAGDFGAAEVSSLEAQAVASDVAAMVGLDLGSTSTEVSVPMPTEVGTTTGTSSEPAGQVEGVSDTATSSATSSDSVATSSPVGV